jgi:hypothetical protein
MFDALHNRPDEPVVINKHKGKFEGSRALIILGGPSGKQWNRVRKEIDPDVIITCNSATAIPGAEYWVVGENLNRAFIHSGHVERDYQYLHVFRAKNTSKFRLINWQNWMPNCHKDLESVASHFHLHSPNIIRFNRAWIGKDFNLREYGPGLMLGARFKKRAEIGCRTDWSVGGVAFQCLHWAGILGCSKVHTIGFDLCFPDGRNASHHWWKGPPDYEPDAFRVEKLFTNYLGVDTQWDWVEAAEFAGEIEPVFKQAGLDWKDHSNGMLSRMGVWCANE